VKANPPSVSIYVSAYNNTPPPNRLGGETKPFLSGTLVTRSTTPVVRSGVQNAATLDTKPLVAPGGLISVFGEQLADSCSSTSAPPLQLGLAGTQVFLDDKQLALASVCDTQINAQVPYDVNVDAPHQIIVKRDVTSSFPVDVTVAAAQPGIFTTGQNGQGPGDIHGIGPDGTMIPGDPTPVSARDTVVIFCTGLGKVSPPVDLGQPAPAFPTAQVVAPVQVSIGGNPAQVMSSVLVPNTVGRYQVQVVVPDGVTPGDSVPVILTVSGQSSPPATMSVR
jgi:uncharacterized protein (TIGR03437 family)